MVETEAIPRTRRVPRWLRIAARIAITTAVVVTALAAGPFVWTRIAASGHLFDESDLAGDGGPRAPIVLVLGAEVAPGGTEPMPFLRGRLDTAAALVATGRAQFILVSGDAGGSSGNEPAVMADYLARRGVTASQIQSDRYGLDTYDSCYRARHGLGVTKALVVTQSYHLARAVALCRHVGIDADGVAARCDDCSVNLVRNAVRDYFACSKAAWDAVRDRPPGVDLGGRDG